MLNTNRTQIRRHAASARRSLGTLTRSLEQMVRAIEELAVSAPRGGRAAGGRKRRPLNPGQRAFRKLQGQYLGLTRHLGPRHKTQVKAIRAGKGYEAAIRRAQQLLGGGRAA